MTSHPGNATNFDAAVAERRSQCGFRISEHVRLSHTPDGAVVLDIVHGRMFRLNFAGSRILELLEQGSAELEIAGELAREFGIDQTVAEADVREFLDTLENHSLLVARAI